LQAVSILAFVAERQDQDFQLCSETEQEILIHYNQQLKALGLLQPFKKSAEWALLSQHCDD